MGLQALSWPRCDGKKRRGEEEKRRPREGPERPRGGPEAHVTSYFRKSSFLRFLEKPQEHGPLGRLLASLCR